VFRYNGRIAGFALVTRGSPVTDDPSVLDVAEFFVLRRYRRVGVGRQAASALWGTLTGRWVVRVAEANQAALTFWIDIVRRYTGGNFTEATRDIAGRRWRVFSFETASSTQA
jgi:predicted acetyltransferase